MYLDSQDDDVKKQEVNFNTERQGNKKHRIPKALL